MDKTYYAYQSNEYWWNVWDEDGDDRVFVGHFHRDQIEFDQEEYPVDIPGIGATVIFPRFDYADDEGDEEQDQEEEN